MNISQNVNKSALYRLCERDLFKRTDIFVKGDLYFDFICVTKERQVVFRGIAASPYQNEEIICFGILIIFGMNFRILISIFWSFLAIYVLYSISSNSKKKMMFSKNIKVVSIYNRIFGDFRISYFDFRIFVFS